MNSHNHDSAMDEPVSSEGGAGGYGSRLTALEVGIKNLKETIDKYMATKKDISDLKVWILSGVLGGMGIAAAITVVIARAFF